MKIHKSVKINTDNGSPGDIIAALKRYPLLPAEAVATEIEIDYLSIDSSLDSARIFSTRHTTTFEWEEEVYLGEIDD